MKILVLDGNENQAVACVHSLARAGYRVHVGAPSSWSKAGWSRSCQGTFRYPSPDQDSDDFVRRVAEEVALAPGTLVLPMTERTTLPLSAQRALILGAGGRLVLPPHETVLRAFDKQQTTSQARALGLAVPQTVLLEGGTDGQDHPLRYPVVLKPRSSEEAAGGKTRATGGPRYARTPEEFRAALADLRARCSAVLAQEFVEGSGVGYFALMCHGRLRAEFSHCRIRDVRPTGSGSAVRVSVAPDPRVRSAALALLEALGWHGVAMVEFRRRPDGTPVFLEVNGRFWNSLALAVHAGADFPALLAHMAEHGDVAPAAGYRSGVRCRWLLGDIRHVIEVLKGAPSAYPGAYPRRLPTVVSFLKPVPGTYHDNFRLTDPLPEVADWLNFFLNKALPRISRNLRLR